MGIPVNQALIANATVFPIDNTVCPVNICKPPVEGPKCLSFQITTNTQLPVFIDINNNPAPPISQIAAMYIDLSTCAADIIVIFADTGYQVQIQGGDSALIPVITFGGGQLPRFYICQAAGPARVAGDTVNIFLLNQFVPEFNTSIFQKAQLYGTDVRGGINTITFPAESLAATSAVNLTTALQTMSSPSVGAANNKILTGLQIYLDALSSTASEFRIVSVFFNTTLAWQFPVEFTNTRKINKLIEVGHLFNVRGNLIGLTSSLSISIDDITNLTNKTAYCNLQIARNNATT